MRFREEEWAFERLASNQSAGLNRGGESERFLTIYFRGTFRTLVMARWNLEFRRYGRGQFSFCAILRVRHEPDEL